MASIYSPLLTELERLQRSIEISTDEIVDYHLTDNRVEALNEELISLHGRVRAAKETFLEALLQAGDNFLSDQQQPFLAQSQSFGEEYKPLLQRAKAILDEDKAEE
jgi:hypothetical protein